MKEKALYRYLLVDPDFRTIVITFHLEHQMQVMCTYVHKSRLSLKRKASYFISEKITATNVSVAHLSKNPIFVPKVNLDEIFHNHIDWKLLKTSKCCIWIFQFWHFPPKFVLLKSTCLVTLFDCKFEVFKNWPKWIKFGFFYWTFVHSKCKHSSLCSKFWMRLFLWFSTTVMLLFLFSNSLSLDYSKSLCLSCFHLLLSLN